MHSALRAVVYVVGFADASLLSLFVPFAIDGRSLLWRSEVVLCSMPVSHAAYCNEPLINWVGPSKLVIIVLLLWHESKDRPFPPWTGKLRKPPRSPQSLGS